MGSSSCPGIKPGPLALGARSLRHQTTRGVPSEWILTHGSTKVQIRAGSQKPVVINLSFPRFSPPQCHSPPSSASPGSRPRCPEKPPPLFLFLVMSLFASPETRAETILLPPPNFPYSDRSCNPRVDRSCNPRVHRRGSGLQRVQGGQERSLEKVDRTGFPDTEESSARLSRSLRSLPTGLQMQTRPQGSSPAGGPGVQCSQVTMMTRQA